MDASLPTQAIRAKQVLQAGQLFEITLQPQADSPTRRPTGPILYIGRAVKIR